MRLLIIYRYLVLDGSKDKHLPLFVPIALSSRSFQKFLYVRRVLVYLEETVLRNLLFQTDYINPGELRTSCLTIVSVSSSRID